MDEMRSQVQADEAQRLAALRRYGILDTPPDGAFDRIAALAARRFDVPIAIVSLVDQDRIWFKSHHGLDVSQIGPEPGLCASAILAIDPYVLTDASLDPRSLANPLVAGDFGLRFYAAVPLRTADGYGLGTLCVIDRKPREITSAELQDLHDLAAIVMDEMELRLAARRADEQSALMAREIDHRVMNSLQFIAGLLSMQASAASAPALGAQLRAAADRVATVARLHRHFYASEPSETMCCASFLERLSEDLSHILGAEIDVEADPEHVRSTMLQPIGLLVSELVTNAAKHGGGRITVGLRRENGACTLSVCDQGPGLPPDFDPAECTAGLGMRVAVGLAQQLGGTLRMGANSSGLGSRFDVSFQPR